MVGIFLSKRERTNQSLLPMPFTVPVYIYLEVSFFISKVVTSLGGLHSFSLAHCPHGPLLTSCRKKKYSKFFNFIYEKDISSSLLLCNK
jgi:hypothetical protein